MFPGTYIFQRKGKKFTILTINGAYFTDKVITKVSVYFIYVILFYLNFILHTQV